MSFRWTCLPIAKSQQPPAVVVYHVLPWKNTSSVIFQHALVWNGSDHQTFRTTLCVIQIYQSDSSCIEQSIRCRTRHSKIAKTFSDTFLTFVNLLCFEFQIRKHNIIHICILLAKLILKVVFFLYWKEWERRRLLPFQICAQALVNFPWILKWDSARFQNWALFYIVGKDYVKFRYFSSICFTDSMWLVVDRPILKPSWYSLIIFSVI